MTPDIRQKLLDVAVATDEQDLEKIPVNLQMELALLYLTQEDDTLMDIAGSKIRAIHHLLILFIGQKEIKDNLLKLATDVIHQILHYQLQDDYEGILATVRKERFAAS